ncbi:MAG: hypothetical protein QXT26_08485 [Thermoproteota archaeon]
MVSQTKYNVRRWYGNVAKGSRVTADVYLRRLGSFCERFNVSSPRQLIGIGEVTYTICSWIMVLSKFSS